MRDPYSFAGYDCGMKKLTLLSLFVVSFAVHAKAPFVDPAKDMEILGPPDRFLFWTPEQQVAGYRNIDKVFPTRSISASTVTLELPPAPVDLGGVIIKTDSSEEATVKIESRNIVIGRS